MVELRSLAESVRKEFSHGVAWMAADIEGKASLICVVSDEMLKRGLNAGELVNSVASLAKGRGGGKPHMAQAGIKAPQLLKEALEKAPDLLKKNLGL